MDLAILAFFVFLYSVVAGGVERTPIFGPIVFLLLGLVLGPVGVGLLDLDVDAEGPRTLALITWVVFGAAVVGQSIGHFTWTAVRYAVLSLTVIRMLPVWLSVGGTGLKSDAKLFLGWFGPRGLASIVFAIIVLDAKLPGGDTLAVVVACTIILSIITHGLTAIPFATAFGKRAGKESRGDLMRRA